MISKAKIKFIQSLQRKKVRDEEELFLIEGEKMVEEALSVQHLEKISLFATETWLDNHPRLPLSEEQVFPVKERELQQISALKTPNKVLLVARKPIATLDNNIILNDWSLYLDGIQDPGNLGTILRIADWFGIPYVIGNDKCADLYNPKTIQSSMGAFLRVTYLRKKPSDFFPNLQGLKILGADMTGTPIHEVKAQKGLIVIGSEGRGISSEVQAFIEENITIPRHPKGSAESLNAAVACGIICSALRS